MASLTDRAALKAAASAQRLEVARDKLAPLDETLLARNGLTSAQVRERVALDLVNRQQTDSSRSLLSILRSNLLTLFNAVVGGSFILLLVLGQWQDALFGFAVVMFRAFYVARSRSASRPASSRVRPSLCYISR